MIRGLHAVHARRPGAAPSAVIVPVFNPATDNQDGWWIDYAGALPWTPTASAGSSGSNGNLVLVPGFGTPAAGTVINGHPTADLDGTKWIKTASAATSFLAAAGRTIVALVRFDSSAAKGANFYDDPSICSDDGGYWGLTATPSGVQAGMYNAASFVTDALVPSGPIFMAVMRYDGTTLTCNVDSQTKKTKAVVATVNDITGNIHWGSNYTGSARIDGLLINLALFKRCLSDAEILNWKSYFNDRYGLSL